MRLDPQAALSLGLLRLCLGECSLGPAGLGEGEGRAPELWWAGNTHTET